jgi:hypothetical protein
VGQLSINNARQEILPGKVIFRNVVNDVVNIAGMT